MKMTFTFPFRTKWLFLLLLLTFSTKLFAQNVQLSGKVTDSQNGNALVGVSVGIQGTANGAVTDADGNYKLSARVGQVLTVSYIGYKNLTYTVTTATQHNFALVPTTTSLSEVVVIGYGQRAKKDVTTSIVSIGSSDIEKSTALTPQNALQGTVAGVSVVSTGGNPTARPVVQIRGVNSFGSSTEPLYVVDGIPITEGGSQNAGGAAGDLRTPVNILTAINPDDIESISVLKDAASAAVYGVRAANGVILITTKHGKKGRATVDFSAYTGISRIPKLFKPLNTQQYEQLIQAAYNANPNTLSGGAIQPIGQASQFGPSYDPASSSYLGNGPTYDWQNAIIKKDAPTTDYNARVSGANDNTNYYVSLGYNNTWGTIKTIQDQRYTLSSNLTSKIGKYFEAGLTTRLISENVNNNVNGDLSVFQTPPWQKIYDPNDKTGFAASQTGTFVANPSYDPTLLSPGAPYIFATGPTPVYGPATRGNMLALDNINTYKYLRNRALGNVYLQVEPITGLKIKGSFAGDIYYTRSDNFNAFDDWRFSQTPGNPYNGTSGIAANNYNQRLTTNQSLQREVQVTYNHTFFKDHNIDVLFDANNQNYFWDFLNASNSNLQFSDPTLWYADGTIPYTTGTAQRLSNADVQSYIGRISYKYKDKYYLEGTLNRNGTSRFAPGKRWGTFPGVSAAWRLTSEDFMKGITFLNDLKLRGGYGQLGNQEVPYFYAYLSQVNQGPHYALGSGNGNSLGGQVQGVALNDFPNTDLTWEKLTETSVGLDATFWGNRFTLSADYFNKITSNIIQGVSLTPSSGIVNAAPLNIGKVRNRGVEVQLTYTENFNGFRVNVSGNVSTVSNEVLQLSGGIPITNGNYRIEVGKPISFLYGYKEGGIFQSAAQIQQYRSTTTDATIGNHVQQPGDIWFVDVNGTPAQGKFVKPGADGQITPDDRTFLGSTIPTFYYGLNGNLSYKNVDLGFLFNGVGNVYRENVARELGETMSGANNQLVSTLNAWTPTNTNTNMPRAVFADPSGNNRFSSRWVENAAYFRLKNLQIGYTIPQAVIKAAHNTFTRLRIYVSATNLFTITKWTGLDPEGAIYTNVSSSNQVSNINNDYNPSPRQYLIGVNASF